MRNGRTPAPVDSAVRLIMYSGYKVLGEVCGFTDLKIETLGHPTNSNCRSFNSSEIRFAQDDRSVVGRTRPSVDAVLRMRRVTPAAQEGAAAPGAEFANDQDQDHGEEDGGEGEENGR